MSPVCVFTFQNEYVNRRGIVYAQGTAPTLTKVDECVSSYLPSPEKWTAGIVFPPQPQTKAPTRIYMHIWPGNTSLLDWSPNIGAYTGSLHTLCVDCTCDSGGPTQRWAVWGRRPFGPPPLGRRLWWLQAGVHGSLWSAPPTAPDSLWYSGKGKPKWVNFSFIYLILTTEAKMFKWIQQGELGHSWLGLFLRKIPTATFFSF